MARDTTGCHVRLHEPSMRVAVTLEQCWHRVPGGTARATLDTVAAVAARGGVDQVGVSAWHREPPPAAWEPADRGAARCPLPRLRAVRRVAAPAPPARWSGPPGRSTSCTPRPTWRPPSTAPMVATVHDLHFLHEPGHFTARGHPRLQPLPRPRAGRGGHRGVPVGGHPGATARRPGIDAEPPPGHAVGHGSPAGRRRRGRRGCGPPTGSTAAFVLFAGTVEPRKNLGRLLEAFGRLGDVDADLVLVGPEGWSTELPAARGPPPRASCPTPTATRSTPPPTWSATRACGRASACRCSRRWRRAPPSSPRPRPSTAEVAGDAALLVDPLDVDAIAGALAPAPRRPGPRRPARRGRPAPGGHLHLGPHGRRHGRRLPRRGRWPRVSRRPSGSTCCGSCPARSAGASSRPLATAARACIDLGPADLDLRLFVLPAFADAHPGRRRAPSRPRCAPIDGRSRARRDRRPSPPGSPAAPRSLDLVHHAGGTVPARARPRRACSPLHDLQPLEATATHGALKRAYLARRRAPLACAPRGASRCPSEFVRRHRGRPPRRADPDEGRGDPARVPVRPPATAAADARGALRPRPARWSSTRHHLSPQGPPHAPRGLRPGAGAPPRRRPRAPRAGRAAAEAEVQPQIEADPAGSAASVRRLGRIPEADVAGLLRPGDRRRRAVPLRGVRAARRWRPWRPACPSSPPTPPSLPEVVGDAGRAGGAGRRRRLGRRRSSGCSPTRTSGPGWARPAGSGPPRFTVGGQRGGLRRPLPAGPERPAEGRPGPNGSAPGALVGWATLWVRHRRPRRSPARPAPAAACPPGSPAASCSRACCALIVVLGVSLVVYARNDRNSDDRRRRAPARRPHPPGLRRQRLRRVRRPDIPEFESHVGIHTHGDGVLHIHPFSQLGVGRQRHARPVLRGRQRGRRPRRLRRATRSSSILGETIEEGKTKCEGVENPELRMAYWEDVAGRELGAGDHHRRLQRPAPDHQRRRHHDLLRRPRRRHPEAAVGRATSPRSVPPTGGSSLDGPRDGPDHHQHHGAPAHDDHHGRRRPRPPRPRPPSPRCRRSCSSGASAPASVPSRSRRRSRCCRWATGR